MKMYNLGENKKPKDREHVLVRAEEFCPSGWTVAQYDAKQKTFTAEANEMDITAMVTEWGELPW